jgi:hypothetical protein
VATALSPCSTWLRCSEFARSKPHRDVLRRILRLLQDLIDLALSWTQSNNRA